MIIGLDEDITKGWGKIKLWIYDLVNSISFNYIFDNQFLNDPRHRGSTSIQQHQEVPQPYTTQNSSQ